MKAMKSVPFLIVTVLLISSVNSLKNHEKIISSSNFSNDVNLRGLALAKHFTDLPAELKLIVLKNFSPEELFELTQNPDFAEYHHLATAAYGLIHKSTAIHFKLNSEDFAYENDAIHFRNVTTLIKFLQSFKKYITNVKINFLNLVDNEMHTIFHTIAECCAETLSRLEIRHASVQELEFMQTCDISFPNIHQLSFFACFLENQKINIEQNFPNVRRLSTTYTFFTVRTWIEENFSNLTHLQLHVSKFAHFSEVEVIRILHRFNQTLTTLSLINPSPDLLRQINANFPKIVNLGIISLPKSFTRNRERVSMEHVEQFSFESSIRFEFSHFIQIPKLKTLRWRGHSEHLLCDFVKNHNGTIQTLEVAEADILDVHLEKMENMLRLESASIRYNPETNISITATGFIDFVKSNVKLTTFRLNEANSKLRQEIYTAFNSSGISGSIEMLDPFLPENGNVVLVKKPHRGSKSRQDLEFLENNFH